MAFVILAYFLVEFAPIVDRACGLIHLPTYHLKLPFFPRRDYFLALMAVRAAQVIVLSVLCPTSMQQSHQTPQ